jgi:AcrR family transcriptional regulator
MQTDLPETSPETASRMPSQRFQAKREQILQTAARLFNAQGVRGATLEDIAGEVGMNLTSIRHYFKRKEDLVAAAFLRAIEMHIEHFKHAQRAGDREARVRDLVHRYFSLRRTIREDKGPEVMVFGDLRSLAEPHAGEVWPRYIALFRTVRAIVADPAEIETDRERVNARAHFVLSQLIRSVFWLPEYPTDEFDRVEARFADILLNGLAAPGAGELRRMPPLQEHAPSDKRSWESFLMAATALINEQGYRGASVDRIAKRLNVTKGSFYHHIDAKGDLVAACFNRNYALLQEAQRRAVANEAHGLDQASAAASALVQRQQTPAGPLLRNSALMSVDLEKREPMLRQLDQIVVRFTDMLSDGIIDGSVRPCDTRIAGQMLMAMINSAAQLKGWVAGLTPEKSVSLYVKPLFKGLYV